MAIDQIRGFMYRCDRCGESHLQEHAQNHYHNSAPEGWARVKVFPSEGVDVEQLLCEKCLQPILEVVASPTITIVSVEERQP